MRKMNRIACAAMLTFGTLSPLALAGDPPSASTSGGSCPACATAGKATPTSAAFETIKKLAGTWIGTASGMDNQPVTITFHPTANGSAVLETLFAGTAHEMLDVYTPRTDGSLVVTHYCTSGQQPRMELTPSKDGALHFAFIGGGNIASANDPHMASVALTIQGDQLTENWSFEAGGKVLKRATIELHRQAAQASARQ